jgi:hypothetical protein
MIMRALNEGDLAGKTIQSVDTSAVNVTRITFSDGSSLDIWAETAVQTQFGDIPGFFVEESNSRPVG